MSTINDAATVETAARAGLRRHQRQDRSQTVLRRAWIVRSVQEPIEIVGQGSGRRVSLRGVARHRLQDDRFQVAGDAPIDRPRPRHDPLRDLIDELEPVRLVERRPEREHLVQRHPERVDVAPRVGVAVEPLGGHVAEGADDIAGAGQPRLAVVGFRQPEVGDPDRPGGVQEQVRRA